MCEKYRLRTHLQRLLRLDAGGADDLAPLFGLLSNETGELGGRAREGHEADFASFIAEHTEKWGKIIRAAGIKAE